MFDRFNQQGDGLHGRRQDHGRADHRSPLVHLRLGSLGIGGQIDKVALVCAALELGVRVDDGAKINRPTCAQIDEPFG